MPIEDSECRQISRRPHLAPGVLVLFALAARAPLMAESDRRQIRSRRPAYSGRAAYFGPSGPTYFGRAAAYFGRPKYFGRGAYFMRRANFGCSASFERRAYFWRGGERAGCGGGGAAHARERPPIVGG
jgi:hypothetical protein